MNISQLQRQTLSVFPSVQMVGVIMVVIKASLALCEGCTLNLQPTQDGVNEYFSRVHI